VERHADARVPALGGRLPAPALPAQVREGQAAQHRVQPAGGRALRHRADIAYCFCN